MTMTNNEWREHQYYQLDPFANEVQPALLNSPGRTSGDASY